MYISDLLGEQNFSAVWGFGLQKSHIFLNKVQICIIFKISFSAVRLGDLKVARDLRFSGFRVSLSLVPVQAIELKADVAVVVQR